MTDLSLDLSACGDFCGSSSTAEGAILSGEWLLPALALASCNAVLLAAQGGHLPCQHPLVSLHLAHMCQPMLHSGTAQEPLHPAAAVLMPCSLTFMNLSQLSTGVSEMGVIS